MLDALGMAQQAWASLLWGSGCFLCLFPLFLLLLEAWDAFKRRCSCSAKRRKVSGWSWRKERRSHAHHPGGGRWAYGCSGPGTFLCFDLNCKPCSEAARERQRWLRVEGKRRDPSRPGSSSSVTSSLFSKSSQQRTEVPRHGGLPQRRLQAPRPLAAATTGSPAAPGSLMAAGAGSLSGRSHPCSRPSLQLAERVTKRLQMHLRSKCLELQLRCFPAIVRRSHETAARGHARPAASTPLCSMAIPRYFHVPEALFLPEEAWEKLELHIRAKKLNRRWDFSAEALGTRVPQTLGSAPEHHPEGRQTRAQQHEGKQVQLSSTQHEESQVQLRAEQPPCPAQAAERPAEPQPEPLPPERADNSGREEQHRSQQDTRLWRLCDARRMVIYIGRRVSPRPGLLRRAVLRLLGAYRLSKGMFD